MKNSKKEKKKSYFKNKYNYIESVSNDKNIKSNNDDFVVVNFNEKEKEEGEKEDVISKIIVENYITYDNKYNNKEDNNQLRSKSELQYNINEKKV